MWYKVKVNRTIVTSKGKEKSLIEYYLNDNTNFAEAGYEVLKYLQEQLHTDGEIEDVCLMKNLKPCGNTEYQPDCRVYIVKFAQDITQDDGTVKTLKYPVPFYAKSNNALQQILDLYIKQGLEDMRVTTISETKWKII
jgi:hypothetical protein